MSHACFHKRATPFSLRRRPSMAHPSEGSPAATRIASARLCLVTHVHRRLLAPCGIMRCVCDVCLHVFETRNITNTRPNIGNNDNTNMLCRNVRMCQLKSVQHIMRAHLSQKGTCTQTYDVNHTKHSTNIGWQYTMQHHDQQQLFGHFFVFVHFGPSASPPTDLQSSDSIC